MPGKTKNTVLFSAATVCVSCPQAMVNCGIGRGGNIRSNNLSVQWFPGHMNKARREIENVMNQVDLVIEVLDARIPDSSRNPMLTQLRGGVPVLRLLNKKDLADSVRLKEWSDYWQQQDDIIAKPFSTQDKNDLRQLQQWVQQMVPARGSAEKPIRVMIAGIPNVGKSSLMNALLGKRVAKVGDEPAVTKGQQKLKLHPGLHLLDTPGILWPKIENPRAGERLAVTGAVRDTAIDYQEVALIGLEFFMAHYPDYLVTRYKLKQMPEKSDQLLRIVGEKRGGLRAGGKVDLHKAAEVFLNDVRSGTLGMYVMETPAMIEDEERLVLEAIARKEAEKLAKKQAAIPQRQQAQNQQYRKNAEAEEMDASTSVENKPTSEER